MIKKFKCMLLRNQAKKKPRRVSLPGKFNRYTFCYLDTFVSWEFRNIAITNNSPVFPGDLFHKGGMTIID